MSYIIPAAVLGNTVVTTAQSQTKESFANLLAAESIALTFDTIYSPYFDIFVRMVGVGGTLQAAIRFTKTGSGSTFIDLDPLHTYTITDGAEFVLSRIRLPGIQARWTLTAGGGAGTTTLEFQVTNRSN